MLYIMLKFESDALLYSANLLVLSRFQYCVDASYTFIVCRVVFLFDTTFFLISYNVVVYYFEQNYFI
jgi:hypothetical protein